MALSLQQESIYNILYRNVWEAWETLLYLRTKPISWVTFSKPLSEGLIDLWLGCISAFFVLLKAENHDETSVLWLIYMMDVTSTVIYQKSDPFCLNATSNTKPFNPGPCRSIPKCKCKLHTMLNSIVNRNSYYYILM